jgi:hypothetical protein
VRTPFEQRCDDAWRTFSDFELRLSLYVFRRDREICATEPTNLYIVYDRTADAVKIGKATSTKDRLSSLGVGNPNPLEIVVSVPAPAGLEKALHRLLAEHRIRGEWFRATPEVLVACEMALSARDFWRDAEQADPGDQPDIELTVEVFCCRANELLDALEAVAS